MEENVINPNEIMNKARMAIETGKFIGDLSKEEEIWLKANNRVIHAAYKMSLAAKKKDLERRRGGRDIER